MSQDYSQLNKVSALLNQPDNFYWMLLGLIVWNAFLLFLWREWFLVSAGRIALLMLFFSIVPMVVLGMMMEGRDPLGDILNPSQGSWMFIFGDLIGLPLAGYCLSRYAQTVDDSPEWLSKGWVFWAIAAGVGLAAGWSFHFIMDAPNYHPAAFNSPTKIYHDFGAYVLLFGTLFFGAVFVAATKGRGEMIWAAGALASVILLWGSFMIHDAKGLDPEKLHVRYNWRTWSVDR